MYLGWYDGDGNPTPAGAATPAATATLESAARLRRA
jgi:hypothetical protein